MESRLAAARALAAQGFAIFPIKAGAKFPPLVKEWPAKAARDVSWWEISPQDNIGIHCAGLVVIDVDPKKGGDESLQYLDITEGVPQTLTTRTPTGGRHLFFRLPAGIDGVANSVGTLGDGLDVRSAGGYVVAPGSEVAAGKYEFVDAAVPVAEAPQWLLERLTAVRATERTAAVVEDADELLVDRARSYLAGRAPAVEGEGGDAWTYATACAVRDMGVSERQALDLLREWNLRCLPPWDESDLTVKVRNAYRYAENPAGSRVALPSDFPVLETGTIVPKKRTSALRLSDFAGQKAAGAGYVIKGFLQRASYAEVYGAPGEGKAQPLDELVLTPDGWKTMGDLQPGDYVIGSAGLPVRVSAVYPQGDKDEWAVTLSNGDMVRCCGEHLWAASRKGVRQEVITTEEMASRPGRTWRLPLVAPVNYAPDRNPLPLDPYLLGALIGDGGCTAYVGFTNIDEAILAEVRQRLPAGHWLRSKNDGLNYQIVTERGQPNHVWTALQLLRLAGKKSCEKTIPEVYMRASPGDRLLLLQGLMDTDGYATGKGRVAEFAVSSLTLAAQVRELVGSLGGVAGQIRRRETSGLPSYRLSFRLQAGASPFRLPRKSAKMTVGGPLTIRVESVLRTGRSVPMQCIAVETADRLYVTAGFALTHNTFTTLDMEYHVAAGREWMGHKVTQGPTLHLAFEGRGGLIARARALRQCYGDEDVPLYVCAANFSITTPEGRHELGRVMAEMPAKPVLIVFDTLAKALMGGDENSAQDVGAFNLAVEALIENTGACVLIVHHSGKDPSKGARGSSALLAALDTEVEVAAGQIRATKQRDVELGPPIGFKLKPVVVGIDEDGDEITSCVVEPAMALPAGRKLTGNARRGFDILCLISPQNDPVHLEDWRVACVKEEVCRARSSFHEMKRALVSKEFIDIADDRVTRRMA